MPADVNEPLASVNMVEPTASALPPEVAGVGELLTDLIRTASPTTLPHVLRPAAALREVVVVASSIERGGRKPPRTNDRTSLRTDVEDALFALGDELKSVLEPAFGDFLAEAEDIETSFDDRSGIVRLRTAAETLLERLREAQAAQAVWRDLRKAVEVGGEMTLETAHLRASQLRELIEERGREWSAVEGRLWEAALHGRFDECQAIAAEDPPRTATVAWFAFMNGDLPDAFQRVGQVQFFSHRAWPEAVINETSFAGFPDFEHPVELDEHALTTWVVAEDVPSPVYARVELTGPRASGDRNPWAQHRPPIEWGRDLVLAIVESATFRRGGSQWKLLTGGVSYHGREGGWSGGLGFHDPRVFEENRSAMPLREGTGEALEELPPEFADMLATREPLALSALQDVRAYEAARAQNDAAQRVTLHVSAFERTLPIRHGEHWNEALAHYFRAWWAINEFDDALFYLAWNVDNLLRWTSDPKDIPPLVRRSGDRVSVSTKALLENAQHIHTLLPRRRRQQRRRLKAAAAWSADPARALKRLEELQRRFNLLLKRALRQRNATIHGVATVPAVVASVDGFIAQLAAVVTARTVASAAEREELPAALERTRADARRTLHELAQGRRPVVDVLYR
jgi:hypothetical protein